MTTPVLIWDQIGGCYSRSTVETRPTGGGELHLVQLAEALARRGYAVTIANGVPSPRYEIGVDYVPNELAPARADVVIVQRYSPDPPTKRERTIIHAIDPWSSAYERHLGLMAARETRVVAVSRWAAAEFPGRVHVIPPMIEPVAAGVKDPQLFIFPCAARKGLDVTLAAWRRIKERHADFADARLEVVSPGYDPPAADKIRSAPDCTYGGALTCRAWRERIAHAAALFLVSSYPETFCVTAAVAEMTKTRPHILCLAGLCGIPEALSNHRLLTTRPDDFDRDVIAAWEDPGAVAWWGGRPVDRSPDALVGEWVELMEGR